MLTSNFDPLVAISVRRAGGRAYVTALHGDGSLAGVDGQGCLVVHFHGDWFRTDTLHTPAQLGQDRPKLSASLAQLISARTLVVLGYSGWDDVFTRSLIATVRGGLVPLKIAWAFYPDDEAAIVRGSSRLLEALRPGIELGRVVLYKGIDAHTFLPRLAERLAEPTASESGAQHAGASGRGQASGAHQAGESGARPGQSGSFFAGESGQRPIVPPTEPEASSSHTAGSLAAVLGTHAEAACAPGTTPPSTSSGTGSQGHGASGMSSGTGPAEHVAPGTPAGPNPFQKAGMLGLAARSYVARAADAALTEALEGGANVVVVRGDFSIGKSSLLLRADRAWHSGAGAAVCLLDLQMMRVDDVNLFFDEFFAEVGRAYGQTFKTWREVQTAAAQRPLLLTLDEFGGLTPEVAQRFVPALYRVVSQLAGALRLVVTTRDPIAEVLASFELSNPNLGDWLEVELRPFTEAELGQLLALLPPRGRAVAEAERATIRERTKMLPKPAQCLCFNLWKDEAAGASDADLAARVRKKELPVTVDNPYRAAGAFAGKAYIRRGADAELVEQIRDNQYYPYFAAPRQSGKSSLIARTMSSLPAPEFRCALVDLSPFVVRSYDDFWRQFLHEVARSANFDPAPIGKGDPREVFKAWLAAFSGRLVIFIDEIDVLLHVECREQIFSKIRTFFNLRAHEEALQRLTFVLAGAAHSSRFISDPRWSPFNVAIEIALEDLSLAQVSQLASYLATAGTFAGPDLVSRVFELTSGSVFLCQLVFEALWNRAARGAKKLDASDVDAVVATIVAESSRNIHFYNIFRLVTQDARLAMLFRRLVDGEELGEEDRKELLLTGLCRGMDPFRNEVYARVFGAGGPLDLKVAGAKVTLGRKLEAALTKRQQLADEGARRARSRSRSRR
ncbi:AAA-like domain-containing protein [Nannocystis pusilla]|uniref:AAA-like domain-containing protein n=1 Tax=Nannocystis pusilla TaxID=889268 RepID=UPI003B7EB2DB